MGYRLKNDQSDPWTARFNRFKAGNPLQVSVVCRVYPELIRQNLRPDGGPIAVTCVVPSAGRQLKKNSPVYQLGEALAGVVDGLWLPNLITKQPHFSFHLKGASLETRMDTVDAANIRSEVIPERISRLVIVDDFCTTGATIKGTIGAVEALGRQDLRILGVVLAKAENNEYHTQRGRAPFTNEHLGPNLASVWQKLENELAK